jgi:hypothetical protein
MTRICGRPLDIHLDRSAGCVNPYSLTIPRMPRPPIRGVCRLNGPNVTALAKYADEIIALAEQTKGHGFRDPQHFEIDLAELRRRLRDMADRMRRDASVTPNAKPIHVGSRPPISGGREVCVVRERRRG